MSEEDKNAKAAHVGMWAEINLKLKNVRLSKYGFSSPDRPLETFITPEQLAKHWQMSLKTLERQRKQGDGPAFTRMGKLIRYSISKLDEWVDANTGCNLVTVQEMKPGDTSHPLTSAEDVVKEKGEEEGNGY